MSGRGAHAALALAGIIAGLPVAAVVQWNRVPPATLWAETDHRVLTDPEVDARIRRAPWEQLVTEPHGLRVTSFHTSRDHGLRLRPDVLRLAGRSLGLSNPPEWPTAYDSPFVVAEDGVTWHRISIRTRRSPPSQPRTR